MQTRHILVPTDFSDFSRAATAMARKLAEGEDARITLLHASTSELLGDGDLEQPSDSGRELERVIHEHLDRIVGSDLKGLRSVKTSLVRGTNPADAICRFAEESDVDLVVLATHGATGVKRFLLGSVAEKVVRHAPCSVLVVRKR